MRLPLPRGLGPLRHRDFALYWFGQAVSGAGTWMELTANTFLLYEITKSPVLLGLGGLFRALPVIVLALVGGSVADRMPRKRLLFAAQVSFLLISLALGTLVVTGRIEFWHIYVANLLAGTIGAFEAPARAALFPTLVPRGEFQNAITLNSVIFRMSTLTGPALAGFLLASSGTASPYFVNAASYLAIIAALLLMRVPEAVATATRSLGADIIGGLRYVRASPILPLLLVSEIFLSLFGHNTALLTIFAADVLQVGAQGLGLMLSAVGAGALAGMFVLVVVGDIRLKGQVMFAAGLCYAGLMLAFAFSRTFELSVALLAGIGLADSLQGTLRNTIAQLVTTDQYRGRVMSMIVLVTRGITQVSQVQTGFAVALLGPVTAAVLGAGAVGATVTAIGVRSPRLRRFESRREPPPDAVASEPPSGG